MSATALRQPAAGFDLLRSWVVFLPLALRDPAGVILVAVAFALSFRQARLVPRTPQNA